MPEAGMESFDERRQASDGKPSEIYRIFSLLVTTPLRFFVDGPSKTSDAWAGVNREELSLATGRAEFQAVVEATASATNRAPAVPSVTLTHALVPRYSSAPTWEQVRQVLAGMSANQECFGTDGRTYDVIYRYLAGGFHRALDSRDRAQLIRDTTPAITQFKGTLWAAWNTAAGLYYKAFLWVSRGGAAGDECWTPSAFSSWVNGVADFISQQALLLEGKAGLEPAPRSDSIWGVLNKNPLIATAMVAGGVWYATKRRK